MEQKKFLLVVIIIGFLFIVAIAAGLLILGAEQRSAAAERGVQGGPARQPAAALNAADPAGGVLGAVTDPLAAAPSAATSAAAGLDAAGQAAPASVDAADWAKDPSAVAGLQPPTQTATSARGDLIIIYGERPNTAIASAGSAPSVNPATGQTVIEVPVPAAAPAPQPAIKAQSAAAAPTAAVAVAVAAETPAAAAAKKPAAGPAAKATPAPKAAPAPAKPIDEYWVQTGSFAARARADAAKQALSAKGIAALVETKTVDAKTFYRVRLGPYASKSEAEYWLSLVKTIDGFGESYVSLLKAKR